SRLGRSMGTDVRYNTEDWAKLMPVTNPLPTFKVPARRYEDWDKDMRTWAYVQEFILKGGWTANKTPIDDLQALIHSQAFFPVPYDNTATVVLDDAAMTTQVL